MTENNQERKMLEGKEAMKCPECGNENLIRDFEAGELVCERCGYVITNKLLDFGPEWRAFNREELERRTRVGSPLTWVIHDKGLSRAH